MSYRLIVTEKPSVGQSIAATLGGADRKDGYMEGGGWLISWCIGCLAELSESAAYDPDYAKWWQEDLTILPESWRFTIRTDKRSLSRHGIGMPVTRGGILEKLVASELVERKKAKKITNFLPTQVGSSLITVLPEALQSPLLTAEWEQRLGEVERGTLTPEGFMDGIRFVDSRYRNPHHQLRKDT